MFAYHNRNILFHALKFRLKIFRLFIFAFMRSSDALVEVDGTSVADIFKHIGEPFFGNKVSFKTQRFQFKCSSLLSIWKVFVKIFELLGFPISSIQI